MNLSSNFPAVEKVKRGFVQTAFRNDLMEFQVLPSGERQKPFRA
jgi:hypothetical protein